MGSVSWELPYDCTIVDFERVTGCHVLFLKDQGFQAQIQRILPLGGWRRYHSRHFCFGSGQEAGAAERQEADLQCLLPFEQGPPGIDIQCWNNIDPLSRYWHSVFAAYTDIVSSRPTAVWACYRSAAKDLWECSWWKVKVRYVSLRLVGIALEVHFSRSGDWMGWERWSWQRFGRRMSGLSRSYCWIVSSSFFSPSCCFSHQQRSKQWVTAVQEVVQRC